MRIVVASHDADFTGAPRVGFDIASLLAKDHDVMLISKREGPLIDLDKYGNLQKNYSVTKTSHAYGAMPFSVSLRQAVSRLKQLKPDLVYANSCGSCEWCVAARLLGIPAVLHTHEMALGLLSLSAADAFKFDIPRYVDLLVSASEEAADAFFDWTDGVVAKHHVFGVAIDATYVRRMARAEVPRPTNLAGRELSNDKAVIAMCGTANARKGFDIFYRAATAMPDSEFLWIGALSGDAASKSVMEMCGAERTDNFFITGETPNPYAYMALCDIFALTSLEDPNPLVVPEALALGKRVVSFQASGGSWRWTSRFGYSLGGEASVERLVAFLGKMLASPADHDNWVEAQSGELLDAVDMERKLPLLRAKLSEVVGAAV